MDRRQEGRRVTGVTLYRHVVSSWLDRDSGKHQLAPEHKRRLMELFAAALWRSGRRAWAVDDLEQWRNTFRDRLLEELKSPYVTGRDHEAGAGGLDDAAELVGHLVRV